MIVVKFKFGVVYSILFNYFTLFKKKGEKMFGFAIIMGLTELFDTDLWDDDDEDER